MAALATSTTINVNNTCGIDFGLSACKIACSRGKTLSELKQEITVDPMGDFEVASFVAVGDEGGYVVGNTAKQQMASRSKYSTSHVKKLIGTNEKISIVNSLGKTIETTPEKISSVLLKTVASIASDVTGSSVTNAVIAVPHDYNDAQKQSILKAAELAKLNVLQLISETSAIALAYGLDEKVNGDGHYCLVDVGFSSTKISIVQSDNGMLKVKSYNVVENVGGNIMNENLVNICIDQFNKTNPGKGDLIKTNVKANWKLKAACEHAVRTLSLANRANIDIDSLIDGIDLHMPITTAKLEGKCDGIKDVLINALNETLSNANLTTGDIKDVLISGGMSHTPLLKRTLALYFKNPNLINDDGSKIKPSEAIALGCAKQAGILCVLSSLSGQANVDRESIEKNLTGEVRALTLSMSVGNRNGLCTDVFKRGSVVPNSKTITMKSGVGEDLKLKFYVGERVDPNGNVLLGEVVLENAEYATKSCTFNVSVDKTGTKFEVTVDDVTQTIVDGGDFFGADEVATMVADAKSSAAKDADVSCVAKAELNDYIFVLLETDEILNDIEEEDVEEIKGKVNEVQSSSNKDSSKLLVELKEFVDEIISQYEEEDDEEELVIVDDGGGGDLD